MFFEKRVLIFFVINAFIITNHQYRSNSWIKRAVLKLLITLSVKK